ncbi:MAG TPA: hypothetical protein VJA82_11805, partial [Sediminibacterium sp.]|uniref:hypothetical protein n=1 Tax=Sediminibacterium sp. TaxID=1917865 RepID=UPI002B4B8BF0
MKKIFLIFNLVCLSFLFVFLVSAQTSTSTNVAADKSSVITFTPNVDIPGFFAGTQKIDSNSIATYINAVYRYGAGLAGVIAMFMIVFAAWQWIIAAGNAGKIENAKETIIGALIGLALLFGGYLLLAQISSRLVELKGLDITHITTRLLDGNVDPCRQATSATDCENRAACALDNLKFMYDSHGGTAYGQCVNVCAGSIAANDCGEIFTINISRNGPSVVDASSLPEDYFAYSQLKEITTCPTGIQCSSGQRCVDRSEPSQPCDWGVGGCECQAAPDECSSATEVVALNSLPDIQTAISNGKLGVTASDARVLPSVADKLATVLSNLQIDESLRITSAYRSFATQTELYNCYLAGRNGACPANCSASDCNEASPPNCNSSTHMAGRAMDICYTKSGAFGSQIETCGFMSQTYNCFGGGQLPAACTQALRNGQNRLRALMSNAGMQGISQEWWHFQIN